MHTRILDDRVVSRHDLSTVRIRPSQRHAIEQLSDTTRRLVLLTTQKSGDKHKSRSFDVTDIVRLQNVLLRYVLLLLTSTT